MTSKTNRVVIWIAGYFIGAIAASIVLATVRECFGDSPWALLSTRAGFMCIWVLFLAISVNHAASSRKVEAEQN